VIGRDGRVAALHYKVIQQAQLKKEIDKLLAANSVALAREIAASKRKHRMFRWCRADRFDRARAAP
jgi:hypothetical protein